MHSKIEDKFNKMVKQANESIEDLSELQSDETEPSPVWIDEDHEPYDDLKLRKENPEMNEKYWERRKEHMTKSHIKTGIEKPSHYNFFGKDTMPLIEKILGTIGYLGFLKGNALKYRLRVGKKEGNSISNDVAKALYYEKLYDDFVRDNTPPKG